MALGRPISPNFPNKQTTRQRYPGPSFNQLAPSEIDKDYIYAKDNNGNPYAPSWHTLNFRSQYKVNDKTSVIATIENITNQRYRTYSSGIAAPGLNLILALKYSL